MAVSTFREIHDGRDGSDQVQKGGAVRRYTRVFRAVTTSNHDDANTVVAHPSCPRLGAVYPYDVGAWCRSRRATSPNKKLWIVTATYSSEREMEEDPNADPPQFTWSTQQFTKAAVRDRNGNLILNSAGDPFDPQPEIDDSRWTCTVTRNVVAVPPWLLEYKDAVNDAEFTIDGISVNAGAAKLQAITIGPDRERNGITYRELSLTISFAETFHLEILDAGFNEFVDGELQEIKLKNGGPTAPVCLDGNGQQVVADTAAEKLAAAVYLEKEVYQEKDFSVLPLN